MKETDVDLKQIEVHFHGCWQIMKQLHFRLATQYHETATVFLLEHAMEHLEGIGIELHLRPRLDENKPQ